MLRIKPNVRAVGQGPTVILLHASAGSGRQWDPLVDALQSRYRLQAVDFYGHGATPSFDGDQALTLEDEAALVEPLIAGAHRGVHLVGHSYGAAVALKLALRHPAQVRSVAVYEPVLFRLLLDYNARHAPAREVTAVGASTAHRLARGFADQAAQRFIDYWLGEGAWQALPRGRQMAIAARMPAVVPHFKALFNDWLLRDHLTLLDMPVLCLTGARTRASTRRIGELLRLAMPHATHEMMAGMGHMGPVTHAAEVTARIAEFLETQTTPQAMSQPTRMAA